MSSSFAISAPEPVLTASPSVRNPTDGFFGYNFSTSDSRHSRRISSEIDLEEGLAPPAYVDPPEYTKSAEPTTLAQYLFKFGFLFPPFWIIGALILLTPLRAPDADDTTGAMSWLPEKTEAERAVVISRLRKAELVWAWRCLFALLILACFAIAAGFTIVALSKK